MKFFNTLFHIHKWEELGKVDIRFFLGEKKPSIFYGCRCGRYAYKEITGVHFMIKLSDDKAERHLDEVKV